MIKAVLFDFDETLQDRTEAFEHYMDAFFALYLPALKGEELEQRREEMRVTGNGGYVKFRLGTDVPVGRHTAYIYLTDQLGIRRVLKLNLTVTGDVPAIWSVYNMGYIVKTRESLFSIDLNHRRGTEFAPMLDFALITHNHGDHWRKDFYDAMTGQGKIVASNFLDNPRFNEMKGDSAKGVGTYRIKDVEIRTSLIDHSDAAWGINFTMAFEIRIGNWLLYHTGDSGRGTEPKLVTPWGRPDLWLFFPGCGINTAKAVEKINAKRIVFGHLWELGHKTRHRGRLDEPLIRRALAAARPIVKDTSLAFWGDRIV